MRIQNSYATSAPTLPVGNPACPAWGPTATADTYGPARPEDLQGLYRPFGPAGSPQ